MKTTGDKTAAHELGQRGEEQAARWYERNGYQILARNWRCFEGELDLIAARDDVIVICEVKARATSRFIDPALAIGPTKQARVRTAAFRWAHENSCRRRLRFDVALVIDGELRLLEAAF